MDLSSDLACDFIIKALIYNVFIITISVQANSLSHHNRPAQIVSGLCDLPS